MNVVDLVKDVVETLRPLFEKRSLSLEIETAIDLPPIWVDPIQMKRVFHNLLSNALSYSRKDTAIRIALQLESPDRLLISFCNQGKGILPSELPKIFDRYYSLSRKFKQIGTGLGLYIARRIVELHGGKIWAESEPEQETCFLITLPVTQQL